MSENEWRDGGNRPLSFGVACAICGERLESQTRDYFYRQSEKGYEKAHRKCVESRVNGHDEMPMADVVSAIDELTGTVGAAVELLGKIAEQLERIANQGAH